MKAESQCLELMTAALDAPLPGTGDGVWMSLHNPRLVSLWRQRALQCVSLDFQEGNVAVHVFATDTQLPSFAAALRDVVDALDEIVAEIAAKQLPDAPTGGAEEFNPFAETPSFLGDPDTLAEERKEAESAAA